MVTYLSVILSLLLKIVSKKNVLTIRSGLKLLQNTVYVYPMNINEYKPHKIHISFQFTVISGKYPMGAMNISGSSKRRMGLFPVF